MAVVLRLITNREFRPSRYGQLADNLEGDLDEIIAQAEDHIENYLDRRFAVTAYTEIHRPSGSRLFLRNRPITALTTVKRRMSHNESWTTLVNSDFEIEPNDAAGVLLSLEDEIAGFEVEVAYSAGYTTIPWDIKGAVLLQTAIFAYTDLEMYGQGDSKEPGLGYVQEDVYKKINGYRKKQVL